MTDAAVVEATPNPNARKIVIGEIMQGDKNEVYVGFASWEEVNVPRSPTNAVIERDEPPFTVYLEVVLVTNTRDVAISDNLAAVLDVGVGDEIEFTLLTD